LYRVRAGVLTAGKEKKKPSFMGVGGEKKSSSDGVLGGGEKKTTWPREKKRCYFKGKRVPTTHKKGVPGFGADRREKKGESPK